MSQSEPEAASPNPDDGVALPSVSVIVAARNAAHTLPACLHSINHLDYPRFEVIVADDGSADASAEIARAAGAVVVATNGRGPSAARNQAVARSIHEIVAFTDADCVVPTAWLRALIDALCVSGAASAGGPQRNVFDRSGSARDLEALEAFFGLASALAEYTRRDGGARRVDHNASCNSAYRRTAFLEVGGFTEGLWPGEDVDLDYRLRQQGYFCYYTPDAVVSHHRPGTMSWFAGMMRRYGRAQRELVRRHGRFRPLHWLPPLAVAAALAQLLWIPRQTRSAIALADAVAVAAVLAGLVRAVPSSLRGDVVRYGTVALVEWNRGYFEG